MNFAGSVELQEHFMKHWAEFAARSEGEYLEMARDVVRYGTRVRYTYQGEERIGYLQVLGGRRKTHETKFAFVGTNRAGFMTTFHVESGPSFWRMLTGNPKEKSIVPFSRN